MRSLSREYYFEGCDQRIARPFDASFPDEDFKRFHCLGDWYLGRRMRRDMPGLHSTMVLELYIGEECRYVAKTVCFPCLYPCQHIED